METPKPQAKPVQPDKVEAQQVEQAKPIAQVKPAVQTKPVEQVKQVINVKPNTPTAGTATGNALSPNALQAASTNVTPSVSPAANMTVQSMNAPAGQTYGMQAAPKPNLGAAGGVNPAFTAASVPKPNLGAAGGVNPAFTAASVPNYMPNLPVYPNPMQAAHQATFPSAIANANANIKPLSADQPVPLPTPIEEAAKDPYRYYEPFIGPYDPCPPIPVKRYVVPINQYLNFQPPGLPQFAPAEALKRGTLWPLLFSPYEPEI